MLPLPSSLINDQGAISGVLERFWGYVADHQMAEMVGVVLGQYADTLHQIKARFGGVIQIPSAAPTFAAVNADMNLCRVIAMGFGGADGKGVFC